MRDELDRPKFTVVGEKAVRFDLPPAESEAPAAGSGGLLDLFRAWMGRAAEDRRVMPRHATSGDRAWLGWWRGEEAFYANPARLSNLSRGGALIHIADPPPEGQSVWVCLGEPEPTECLEATVIEVRSARRNECAVRIAFREPCPHSFFEAAVCLLGPAPSGRATTTGRGNPDS